MEEFLLSTYLGLSEQSSTCHVDLLHFRLAFNRLSQHILHLERSGHGFETEFVSTREHGFFV